MMQTPSVIPSLEANNLLIQSPQPSGLFHPGLGSSNGHDLEWMSDQGILMSQASHTAPQQHVDVPPAAAGKSTAMPTAWAGHGLLAASSEQTHMAVAAAAGQVPEPITAMLLDALDSPELHAEHEAMELQYAEPPESALDKWLSLSNGCYAQQLPDYDLATESPAPEAAAADIAAAVPASNTCTASSHHSIVAAAAAPVGPAAIATPPPLPGLAWTGAYFQLPQAPADGWSGLNGPNPVQFPAGNYPHWAATGRQTAEGPWTPAVTAGNHSVPAVPHSLDASEPISTGAIYAGNSSSTAAAAAAAFAANSSNIATGAAIAGNSSSSSSRVKDWSHDAYARMFPDRSVIPAELSKRQSRPRKHCHSAGAARVSAAAGPQSPVSASTGGIRRSQRPKKGSKKTGYGSKPTESDPLSRSSSSSSSSNKLSHAKRKRSSEAGKPRNPQNCLLQIIKAFKALLAPRGAVVYRLLKLMYGDDLNRGACSAFLQVTLGAPGIRWPDMALRAPGTGPKATEQHVVEYLGRFLSSAKDEFVHPGCVVSDCFFKALNSYDVKDAWLAAQGLYPGTWALPLAPGKLAITQAEANQLPAKLKTRQEVELSINDIVYLEEATVAAAERYDSSGKPAALRAALAAVKRDEQEDGKVKTGIDRKKAIEVAYKALKQQQ